MGITLMLSGVSTALCSSRIVQVAPVLTRTHILLFRMWCTSHNTNWRSKKKVHTRLILFKGLPGSGKSTLSRAPGQRLGLPIIDKDDIDDVLHGQVAASGGLAYEIMLRVARRQLLQSLSVICDSPLLYSQTYERAQGIAIEANASLAIIECLCSYKQIWQRRIDSRQYLHLSSHHRPVRFAREIYNAKPSKRREGRVIHNAKLLVGLIRTAEANGPGFAAGSSASSSGA